MNNSHYNSLSGCQVSKKLHDPWGVWIMWYIHKQVWCKIHINKESWWAASEMAALHSPTSRRWTDVRRVLHDAVQRNTHAALLTSLLVSLALSDIPLLSLSLPPCLYFTLTPSLQRPSLWFFPSRCHAGHAAPRGPSRDGRAPSYLLAVCLFCSRISLSAVSAAGNYRADRQPW